MWDESRGSIAVGVDDGGGSTNAVRFAALEGQRQGVELALVHVVSDAGAIAPPYYVPPSDLQRDMDTHGRGLPRRPTVDRRARVVDITAPPPRHARADAWATKGRWRRRMPSAGPATGRPWPGRAEGSQQGRCSRTREKRGSRRRSGPGLPRSAWGRGGCRG
jgi:hypothetical protein